MGDTRDISNTRDRSDAHDTSGIHGKSDIRDTSNIRGKSNVRDTSNIVDLERSVLRFLCSEKLEDASLTEARHNLAGYRWRDEEHRVVFETLARVRKADLVPLRAQLAQHATRMGFPDVEWERYFQPAETRIDFSDWQGLKREIEALLAAQAEQR